jgi:hypothetical protein
MNTDRDLRVQIGFGALLAITMIAAVHALTIAMALKTQQPTTDTHIVDLPPLLSAPAGSDSIGADRDYLQNCTPRELPSVNLTAQQEKKQQIGPGTKIGQIGPMPGVAIPSTQATTADCPSCPPVRPAVPQPQPSNGNKEYQLLLFINNDAQSQQLLGWFNNHPRFQFLRGNNSRVAVQVYAPGDALYRARYSTVVPPSEFPAIVLADKYGGHIHAAGKTFIPRDPEKLYSDLQLGAKLYAQAAQQRPADSRSSGAMTASRQYQWDDAVSPDLRLQEQPPDEENIIPSDPQEALRPGGLLDQCGPEGCPPNKSALIWTNASEITMAGLAIVAIIAATALVAKLVRK